MIIISKIDVPNQLTKGKYYQVITRPGYSKDGIIQN